MTLGVVKEYRRLKIGSYLLNQMLTIISKMKNVLYVCLHVQTTNAAAAEFYKRHGFYIDRTIDGYYASNRIEHPDAYFLKRSVTNFNS
jgi:ribosomal protein S18 acetylase RimI-like enzyme